MLEEGGLTDELLLLTDLLAGVPGLCQLHLQGAERRPHDLTVTEVLRTQHDVKQQECKKEEKGKGKKKRNSVIPVCFM